MAFNHGYSDIRHCCNLRSKFIIQLRKKVQKAIFCIVLVSLRITFPEFLWLDAISLLTRKRLMKCIVELTVTIQFKLFTVLCSDHYKTSQEKFLSCLRTRHIILLWNIWFAFILSAL